MLEERLGKSFLHLACRHHIAELLLRSVFETHLQGTSGPKVPIFERLKSEWDRIDTKHYQTGMDDELIAGILEKEKDRILAFIADQYKVFQNSIAKVFL